MRVGGAWHYRYRGIDSNGDTLDVLLRATRDRNAAIAFFRKTVGASHTTLPRVVNVDKNPAYPIAVKASKHAGLFRPRSSLRQCKHLNNVIEQDHRFIKRRTRPMLGFKRFTTAWRTVRGIEMMHALRKGQARWMAKGDVVGQTRLIHKVFGWANGLSRVIPNVATEPDDVPGVRVIVSRAGFPGPGCALQEPPATPLPQKADVRSGSGPVGEADRRARPTSHRACGLPILGSKNRGRDR